MLAACASAPQQLDQDARQLGFRKIALQGGDYPLYAFENQAGRRGGVRLHVYLEGDGSPWTRRRRVSRDPTPRNPVMLRLMALDSSPALYLGRPCYMGLADAPACNPLLWTHQRYSQDVVDSMVQALGKYLTAHRYSELVFMGHSGGGTLAVLIAPFFQQTIAVVTLAGNLDTDRWTEFHGFSPLTGSLNPARLPPLQESISELHFVGDKDENILPEFVRSRKSSNPGAEIRVVENFDHHCCWQHIWPEVLKRINQLN